MPSDKSSFAGRVMRWQRRHGRRDLPWQDTRDPYRIWVSEIMLQQTQVAAVVPYYAKFLHRFPDVDALAAAPADDVMAAWAGLGYYSRARNLHACAKVVVEHHGSRFPRTVDELAALPGIGRSTAAAIAAFSFGERAAILDGNVKRVLARHYAVDGYPGAPAVERRLWVIAERELPAKGIEAYTQGLMDLGATLCTRANPRCDECPVAASCIARRDGRVNQLPAPRPSKPRPVRHVVVAIVRDGRGSVLLEARPASGIWGGLLSLPEFEPDSEGAALKAAIAARFALSVDVGESLPDLKHDFSHYSLVMHPRIASVSAATGAAVQTARWLGPGELQHAALPAPIRRLLRQVSTECCFR